MNKKNTLSDSIKTFKVLILLVGVFSFLPFDTLAQKVVSKSEGMRPDWLANGTPAPRNSSFEYQITEGEGKKLEDAKYSCLLNLSTYIRQGREITQDGTMDINVNNKNGNYSESENYNFSYDVKGEKINVNSRKYDEYWEYIEYPNGDKVYRCYTLFGVAKKSEAGFDELTFTRKYGARGLVRSIIPGWGQMYKGSTVKGACIIGGEVLLVGGIIASESMRSSYIKKMKEDPKHLVTYNTKADNWENTRNICIGGAAALYVYNLIDAIVANGRKRTVVSKSNVTWALYPMAGDYNGVTFALKF